jgi:hypothetical protein
MVGAVKQIVDAVAAVDIRRGNPDAVVGSTSVASLEIWPGQVIVHKG